MPRANERLQPFRLVAGTALLVQCWLLAPACSKGNGSETSSDRDPIDPSGDEAGDVSSGDDPGADTNINPTFEEGEENANEDTNAEDEATADEEDSGPTTDLPRFDLPVPDGNTDCNDGEYDFSIIWIANSDPMEGTVSKIDTRTLEEIGRYRTGPRRDSDPSRTSVNLLGSVAVANRSGSVTMIALNERDQCVDRNGDGIIQTSDGPGNVLPWGDDECVLWHHEVGYVEPNTSVDNQGGPRALAWDNNIDDPDDPCAKPQPRLWVGWRDQPDTVTKIRRLTIDGEADEETDIAGFTGNWHHGAYGGAIDGEGNFWVLGTAVSLGPGMNATGTLARIDAETMEVDLFQPPQRTIMYGMALDPKGNVWTTNYDGIGTRPGALFEFDVDSETWSLHEGLNGIANGLLRGMMIDEDGDAWVAISQYCGLGRFDTNTKRWVDGLIALPGCGEPVGISIDSEAFVWVVDRGAEQAYRVAPDSPYDSEVVGGLRMPYTYSDMTGAGLGLQVDPPGR